MLKQFGIDKVVLITMDYGLVKNDCNLLVKIQINDSAVKKQNNDKKATKPQNKTLSKIFQTRSKIQPYNGYDG